jgi:hypothetical protein
MTRNTLFLASAVRSGSTYVAEEIAYRLQRDGGFQFFDLTRDLFSRLTNNSNSAEIRRIYENLFLDASGWASSKIHCAALSIITREARRDQALRKAFFGSKARWIIVRRRDKMAQAVSLAVASRTGAWHAYKKFALRDTEPPEVTFKEIETALHSILLDDVYLEAFARNIATERMIRVDYEDVRDSGRKVADAVIALCGLKVKLRRDKKRQVAKIVRTSRTYKGRLANEFAAWFAENHHKIEGSRDEGRVGRTTTGTSANQMTSQPIDTGPNGTS